MKVLFLVLFFPVLLFAAENININAEEFEFDGVKDLIFAKGDVVVTQRDITLTSPRGTYEKAVQKITLHDGVKMVRQGMILTCDEAIADGGEDQVYAVGNVKFSFQDISGSSDTARYDIKAEKIYMDGNPEAHQDEDYIVGEQVIIDLRTNKVITRGNAKVELSLEKL